MDKKQRSALVLLSGGIDSAACLNYYIDEDFNIFPVFIDYGQKAKFRELSSARKIAKYYNIELKEILMNSAKKFSSGEIACRNAYLVLTALMYLPKYKGIISLGIHSGTPYYDCSEPFVASLNQLLYGYFDGKVLLDIPFLKWNKSMIYEYCRDNTVPLDLTYSCENGTNPPCGFCLSCQDRKELNVS